ncbi:hypothetical protein ACWDR1_29060 [Streptosporangium sandarakinum]
MITMVGYVVIASALLVGVPAVILYLAPAAGLDPTVVAVLIAVDLLIAAVWLLLYPRLGRTPAAQRAPRRPRKS